MARSQAATNPMPLAAATPCTWAITGLFMREMVTSGSSMRSIHSRYSMAVLPSSSFTSMPAQKALPAPRTSTARTFGSASMARSACCRSMASGVVKVFSWSGRLRVMVPTKFSPVSTMRVL